jgi:purine-binding chemotaxis protein CheW
MGSDAEKTGQHALQMPSLEALIDVIDRQVDRVPHPYAPEGVAVSTDKEDEAQKKKGRQYLRFYLNDMTFAIPLQNTLEIDYLPEITPLPNLPRWVRGICNLRGNIFSVVDLKRVLELAPVNAEPIRKLILMKSKDIQTAVLVDRISGTVNIDVDRHKTETAMPLHPASASFVSSAIVSGTQTIHLLDIDELMAALVV